MILRVENNSRRRPITRFLSIPWGHEAKLLWMGSCKVLLVRQCTQGRSVGHKSPIYLRGWKRSRGYSQEAFGVGEFEVHDA